MTTRIVLAYSGGVRASAAIGWLRERYHADVITLTVDVGQERDLVDIRARALTLGAARAHVIDRREACAAAAVTTLRGARAASLDPAVIAAIAPPVIASALAEVAAIEHAVMVAHAAVAGPLPAVLATRCALPIADVAGGTTDDAVQQARARGVPLPSPTARWSASRHLLCRSVPETPTAAVSSVDVTFADGVPVAVTGVVFSPAELFESLALLGGRHAIGRLEGASSVATPAAIEAPGAVLLHAAYRVLDHSTGIVRLTLHQGQCTASMLEPTPSDLVNHA